MRGSGGARGTEEPSVGQKRRAPIWGAQHLLASRSPASGAAPRVGIAGIRAKIRGFFVLFYFVPPFLFLFFNLFFSPYLVSEEFILVEN